MHEMTKQNLQSIFAGESQAHMKYGIFSQVAEKEAKPNMARLFKAIAYAEEIHAMNHLRALAGVGKTIDNLAHAIKGESFEVDEMYPAYMQEAKLQSEKGAERTMHYALEAEKIHARLYKEAEANVKANKDIELAEVYICPVCGYTVVGNPPDICPVCGAKKETFRKF